MALFAIVPADTAYVIERLGRYHRTLHAGLHFLAPVIDRIAFRYSLAPREERLTDVGITHDNVPFSITSTYRWQIADPKQAAYASASEAEFVAGLVRTCQRDAIAKRSSNDIRETTRELQQAVLRAAAEPAAQAGVKIIAIDVERIARANP